MHIPRLLILSALSLAWVAPVWAQSQGKDAAPQQPDGLSLPRTIPAAPGTTDETSAARVTPRLLQRARTLQQLALNQNDATCYSIRVYRVKRDDPESDSTKPAGYSTCQPSARFQVKTAVDSVELEPR
jgi:hypothetical protein